MTERLAEWAHSDELVRALPRAAATFACALALAWASRPLVVAWMRRVVSRDAAPEAALFAGLVRGAVLMVGAYEATRSLPLPPVAKPLLDGALFVAAVLLAARAGVVLGRLLLHGWLDRTAEGAARERARREYLPVASTATTLAVALLAAIAIAHHFGHDVSSLVAAFGVGSLAVGLAAQQTLGNMIAGFTLLIDRPFVPGDEVRLQSGEVGEVDEIGIRSTRLRLGDGAVLVVPNGELANSRVVNRSSPALRARVEVRLRVGLRADLERVAAALREAAREGGEIAAEPAPAVALAAVDAAGAELVLSASASRPAGRAAVEERLRRALLARIVAGEIPPPEPSAAPR
jgi:small-conductance mechanosensitive channel